MHPDLLVRSKADGSFLLTDAFSGETIAAAFSASTAIQAAIDQLAGTGGSIALARGLYQLETPVRLAPRITLAGSGAGTQLMPAAANAAGVCIHGVRADQAVIRDLCCRGDGSGRAGIVLEDTGLATIRDIVSRDFAEHGILLQHDCFCCRLSDNTTSGNGISGTCIADSGECRGGDWVPNLVTGCLSLGDRGHGFWIKRAFCTNLVGCQVYQPRGHGILVSEHANSTCITGCRVYQGMQNGILVDESHEINVSSNIVCWNKGHGIELRFVFWGTVSANNFIDNGARTPPQRHGIFIHTDSRSLQVTGNAIFNWPGHQPMIDGIHETADCMNNQITGNSLHRFSGEGVTCLGKGSITSDNLLCPDSYPHPSKKPPLPPYTDDPELIAGRKTVEFDTRRLDAVLAALRGPTPTTPSVNTTP